MRSTDASTSTLHAHWIRTFERGKTRATRGLTRGSKVRNKVGGRESIDAWSGRRLGGQQHRGGGRCGSEEESCTPVAPPFWPWRVY
eukprot:2870534-Rhodomonas_salina.3